MTFQRVSCRSVLLIVALGCASGILQADPSLPHLFSDHMVLQRDMDIRVWGLADPGEKIAVSLAQTTRGTTAGVNRHWEVALPPISAGGPYVLTVRGKSAVEIKDVMIGEVWVASGQSNMTFALSGATTAADALANANRPEIRLFTVPGRVSLTPQQDTRSARWQVCTSETAKNFSAVAYFFAVRLEDSLHVPVGIIVSAWPGSSGEEWTDTESLNSDAILQPILTRWNASATDVRAFAAQAAPVDLEFDDFELLPTPGTSTKPFVLSDFDTKLPTTSTGGVWTYSWRNAPQTAFSVVSSGRGAMKYGIQVKGSIAELDDARLDASLKPQDATDDLSSYAGMRFWARGQGEFRLQALQPTITDTDNYESATFKATPEWQPVTIWFKDLKQEGWGVVEPLTLKTLTGFSLLNMPEVGSPDRPPAGLYEGMIVPIEPYRIRGVIWYQGEGNGWRGYQYRWILPALIRTWRSAWAEGDFPFLIVQLPNYGTSPELGNSLWAEVRDAQFLAKKTEPNTGLIVTIDVGDPKNLHPPRKQPVGDRLALWALGTTYGQKVVYSGPLYHATEVEGDHVRIGFDVFGSQLVARGDVLKGFSIAGADRKFHWADARIDGDTVIVSSADVPGPVAVRYDWANSPEGNLYNAQGLPASPFRTDDWPGETYSAR
jgi:sialate O-acetylesterase